MKVVTFYSYKGGVGRTLASANFGLYLAKTGQKVVLADMDFEAPGLDSKFPSLNSDRFTTGLLDHFSAFEEGQGLLEIHAEEIPLSDDITTAGGRLWLIPAGNYTSREYYSCLSKLNWEKLTSTSQGLTFCLDLVRRIKETFDADVLVIDSRTGLTEIGGLCTQVLPDAVVLLTSTSSESLSGTRRIYDRISNSAFIGNRLHGRDKVDIRVVLSRIPRVDYLPDFQEKMMKRVGLDVPRLYFLFDQKDLLLDDYLALNRFAEEHPAILDDYVELFAAFNPEGTMPYILRRLESFRSAVTIRSPRENTALIQELVTLFPCREVYLEAARYYRLAKGGDGDSVKYFLKYLELQSGDVVRLMEFVDLCDSVTPTQLLPRDVIAAHFREFGIENLSGPLLNWYIQDTEDLEVFQVVVELIESDRRKLSSPEFRKAYFVALHFLGQWQKIVDVATEKEMYNRQFAHIIADANAILGNTIALMRQFDVLEPQGTPDASTYLRKLSIAMPVPEWATIKRESPRLVPYIVHALENGRLQRSLTHGKMEGGGDVDFLNWLSQLCEQVRSDEEFSTRSAYAKRKNE